MPEIIDAEDGRLIAQGLILCVIIAVVLLALAATLGLAWAVFRFTGGLL